MLTTSRHELSTGAAPSSYRFNLSGPYPAAWANWSNPNDCLVVPFSRVSLIPDSIVDAETRRVVKQTKNCLLLLIFLIGAPTNVINMAVFYKQGIGDRVTLCLFFLALTDAFYLTLMIIFQAEQLYIDFERKEMGRHFAFVANENLLIMLGAFYASPVLSAIIAVERCLCVFNPLKVQNLIRTRTIALIILTVYVLVYSLSFVLFLRFRIGCLFDPLTGSTIRSAVEPTFFKKNKDLINFMDGIVFGVGVLGGTMVVVIISTVLTVTKLGRIRQWRSETTGSFSSRDLALTKMLVVSSVWFVVCVAPFAVFNFMRLFFPEVDYGQKEHNLFVSCVLVGETFVLIKPGSSLFIYYTMGSKFRKVFWSIFGRRKKSEVKPRHLVKGGHA